MKNNTELDTNTLISRIEDAINQLKSNDFTLYFFVVDSKNVPNGSMYYTYQLAKTLHDKGYNVKMLYQLENEYTASEIYNLEKKEQPLDPRRMFGGVSEWLGQEYADLPHQNIVETEWSLRPSDFLFIPEALSNFMFQTYRQHVPCKRYVIQHNFNNITDFIPLGVEWKHYGITDVITNSESQAELTKSVFPYVKATVLPPYLSPIFKKPIEGKKLIVNVISKKQSDVNRVIKQFYWKYPMYKFVSFRDVRGYSMNQLAEILQESPITVWMDEGTSFGYSALAAMRCGNLVIGKVPDTLPDWMKNDNSLYNNGIWVYDINKIPDFVSVAISAFLRGEDEQFCNDDVELTNAKYNLADWNIAVEEFAKNAIEERMKSFIEAKNAFIQQIEKNQETDNKTQTKEELK